MWEIGSGAKDAVPALIECLDKGDHKNALTQICARALGGIGPEAQTAIPQLLRACADKDFMASGTRSAAISALGKIGVSTPETISALVEAMTDKDEYTRAYAVSALGMIGSPAAAASRLMEKMQKA
jgi:HEAT repeat protein